ncbi:MAG TPA: DUF2934 domain-containing protein [Tianweitania sediminis]|jgi:hypothetical protein|nr:DUF2934 domain-containing protein [Tianweitania sediminis]
MTDNANKEDRIRARAHAIWQQEGEPHSREDDHWHQAAREIEEEDAASGSGDDSMAINGDVSNRDQVSQLHEDVSGSPQAEQLGKQSKT